MLTKAERFADTRKDRYERRYWEHASHARAMRKVVAKAAPKQWRAVAEDRRFARCALVAALDKQGLAHFLPDSVQAPLHETNWPRHDAIPLRAFLYAAAHPAEADPTKIACYPTRADAKRGREIVMSPGRFFAAAFPNAQPAEVQAMAEAYAASHTAPVVHFADTADSWCVVYASARGFNSCMGAKWEADDKSNPIRFYFHKDNDLRLAFLTHDGQPDGETVARSIVNDAKKKYVRVYGDARLHRALESAGYVHDPEGALDGQKCTAKATCNGELIAPYLDAIQQVSWDGESKWCRIDGDGEWEAANTDGTATGGGERYSCDECGDNADEEDITYSEHHDVHICDHCRERNFTLAVVHRSGSRDYIRDDEVIHIGGEAYRSDPELLMDKGFVCDEDCVWQDADDCVYLEYRGEYVLIDNCTRLDVAHDDDEWARDCDIKAVMIDGEEKTVHEDYDGPEDSEEDAEACAA